MCSYTVGTKSEEMCTAISIYIYIYTHNVFIQTKSSVAVISAGLCGCVGGHDGVSIII